jgi:hypothetical protein
MSPSPPFVDHGTGTIDTTQILAEAIPLARLIGVFVVLALVPFGLVFFTLGNSALGAIFTVAAQFILAIGSGIVLMYVIARGMQLAEQ